MSSVRFARNLGSLRGPCLLLVGLAVVATAYAPGLGGSLHFDDKANLDGLSEVVDRSSAAEFIAQGIAGPTGRPLALASFVPQAFAWPVAPGVLLYTNLCLHLLNGVLVAWLVYLLGTARGSESSRAGWIAAASATIWMLLPLLASSSLLIVQRMTLLSATFLLVGFIGYLYSRRLVETRPALAVASMTACLGLGTGLATLSKENGILLPVLILITEATLLMRPARAQARSLHTAWVAVFLIGPSVLLLAYLSRTVPYGESILLVREFSGADRVLTQAHILWEYLYHAFLPATSNLGPFHDDHRLYTNWLDPRSIVALAAWILVAAGAVAFRRRAPLFAFAVAWYIGGHLLESTTVSLELYFEHRNYVPLVGPMFALVAAVAGAGPRWQLLARFGLLAYGVLVAIVLFATTSLWGKPTLAAEMWAMRHPDSFRATQYLVRQLEQAGNHWAARRTLQRFLEANPNNASASVQVLLLSCMMEPQKVDERALAELEAKLREASYESAVFESVRQLFRVAEEGHCDAVTPRAAYDVAKVTAANAKYQAAAAAQHNLHILMAEYAFAERNLDLTMHHIESALSASYTMPSLTLAVRMLSSAGLQATALEFVADARTHVPSHPLRAAIWERDLAALDHAVRESMQR